MRFAHLLYGFGVLCAALAGFFSPAWYLGFVPLAVGAVWAAYDLVEVGADGNTETTPRRRV